jgi:hypothetical protein
MFDTDERSVRTFVLHVRLFTLHVQWLTLTGSTVRTLGLMVQISFLTAHISGSTVCAFKFDDPKLGLTLVVSALTFSYTTHVRRLKFQCSTFFKLRCDGLEICVEMISGHYVS